MVEFYQLVAWAKARKASDLHLSVGSKPIIRLHGKIMALNDEKLTLENMEDICRGIIAPKSLDDLYQLGEMDLCYASDEGRFRVNIYQDRQGLALAIRMVNEKIPTFEELGLPEIVSKLMTLKKGLVLVTGPTGSGKSTTLASMIAEINRTRNEHIITLEDPIEYLHEHDLSMVHQREMKTSFLDFDHALRSALRQDPDVILLGEMRDLETIRTAITAAETGHLVLSTLHTSGAAQTVDRIIDVFPPHQQNQIRIQLSMVLEGIISQQLLETTNGLGRVAAFEVLLGSSATRNIIREGKTHQIQGQIQMGKLAGMVEMDSDLLRLYQEKKIARKTALAYAHDHGAMVKSLEKISKR